MEDNAARIELEVTGWDGVSSRPHRYGGIEFVFDGHELGHLHGSRWADVRFPQGIARMLVETGRAQPHHVLPETGWVSHQIRDESDADAVVELLRLALERIRVAGRVAEARSGERY